jgi:ParB-like chromosome segregation protein Spo0J
MNSPSLEIDLHRLDLRFAATRLLDPRAVDQIATSIERCGQIVPCLGVGDGGGGPVVLIDGYRRVEALRRLGRDVAKVEPWTCDLAEALASVLARTQGRAFAVIEEGLLLRELTQGQALSQHEVARRCGRDVSWVNRRLHLISAVPETVLAAVRDGRLSCWAATRVLAPLARANSEHAERFLSALQRTPLSTREQRCWFEHYAKASRAVRERMVDQPRLFLEALGERREQHAGARLQAGPEGQCAADLRCVEAVLGRLRQRVATLRPLPAFLWSAVPRLRAAVESLATTMERTGDHDPGRDPRQRPNPGGTGPQPAHDQPHAGPVA